MIHLRRAWRFLATPPTSWEAGVAALAIPLGVAWLALAALDNQADLIVARLLILAWAGVALHLVRQRDQARADTACHLWQTIEQIGRVVTQQCETCLKTRVRVL